MVLQPNNFVIVLFHKCICAHLYVYERAYDSKKSLYCYYGICCGTHVLKRNQVVRNNKL